MPLDPVSGVYHERHGRPDGRPLMITLPLSASYTEIFGEALRPVLQGYLQPLADTHSVLLVDYPSIGRSRNIAPEELTADRVCSDLLAVATAAGFDRFAYWGYSWGGAVGVQLAARTDRLTALAIGGWAPLGRLHEPMLISTIRKQPAPEASSMVVLRSTDQYRQWEHFYRSLCEGSEEARVASLRLPRLLYWGAEADLVEAGIPVPIASANRAHADTLRTQGWALHEIDGEGHPVCMKPDLVVPPVLDFLNAHGA